MTQPEETPPPTIEGDPAPAAPLRRTRTRRRVIDPNAPSGPAPYRPLHSMSAMDRRAKAYRILGVDPNMLVFVSQITPFFRKIPGGIPAAMEYLRTSDAPEARAFMSRYDDITLPVMCREVLPLEAFAIASGVTGEQIISAVVNTARIRAAQHGSMLAAAAHPAIVEASSLMALTPEGTEHAMANLKHMQFLPTSKGSQVNVQVDARSQSATLVQQSLPAPSPEASIRRMVKSLNTVPALPASTAEYIPVRTSAEPEPEYAPVNASDARRQSERRHREAESADILDAEDDE